MAVLYKILASALLVVAVTQSAFGAPKDATGTRGSSGSTWKDPVASSGSAWRDPVGSSSVYSATDPKRDVELVDPLPLKKRPSGTSTGTSFGSGTPTGTSTGTSTRSDDCRGAHDGPSNYTIVLLETRADQLESEVKTPRRSVIEALGEDNVRRLHAEFATAAAGFRGMLPDARRLALEANLPCADRKTILKRYTEKNASFTKKVADAYGVLASKVREAISKKGKGADSRLKHAADEYDSLGATYLQAHGRAERQRAAAAKLTTDGSSHSSSVPKANEQTRPSSVPRKVY